MTNKKRIELVNGKLIKHKHITKEPSGPAISKKSTTTVKTEIVEDRDPEFQTMGEGFNMKTFIVNRPSKQINKSISSTRSVIDKKNDIVAGLGLLNFGSALKNTKSKNIKLII